MKGFITHIYRAHNRKDYRLRNELMRKYDDASLSRFQESEEAYLAKAERK